ncbi:hypothetical protein [Thiofilum flexile]|uniref:hypothetical protein n=1 Tax=Thiofilum flexile TaxID=125627 RepID=UPI00036E7449|nr:hypothetical protein [Thiofilum flexile]
MSNDNPSSNKSLPDNHLSPTFPPDSKQKHKPETEMEMDINLAKLGLSHLGDELDILDVLESSSHRPVTDVTASTVNAFGLSSAPVVPNFPELNTHTTPVVSHTRVMPDLTTVTSLVSSWEQPTNSVATPAPIVEQRPTASPSLNQSTPAAGQNNSNTTKSTTPEGGSGGVRVDSKPSDNKSSSPAPEGSTASTHKANQPSPASAEVSASTRADSKPIPSTSEGSTASTTRTANQPSPVSESASARVDSKPSSPTPEGAAASTRTANQPSPASEGANASARVDSKPSSPTSGSTHSSSHSSGSESPAGSARVMGLNSSINRSKLADNNKDSTALDEPAVSVLQKVINAYNQLEQDIASNKVELESVHSKLLTVKEKKQALEVRLHEITPQGFPAPLQNTNNKETVLELDSLYQDVKESKMNTQNRSCDTVIEYTKSIRKHIVSDSQKAEEFLRPLSLSCEILKTNIQHVRTLEQVVELMEIKKSLTTKRNEVHKTISLLMGQIA